MSGTGKTGIEGKAPVVKVLTGNPEAIKYGRMWAHPEYRQVAPGEDLAQIFLQHARPKAGAECIDFGTGTGRGALMLAVLGGLRVTMLDFVNNSLDDDIRKALVTQAHVLRFIKADLEQPITVAAEYGYCTDVMEHIPEEKVGRVLQHILMAARHVFFSISMVDDSCGKLIGETLHLTVKPFAWWLGLFNELGCVIHWSQDVGPTGLFYVSAWQTTEAITEIGVLNTEDAQVKANVAVNIARGWQQVVPHPTNTMEVMILGGGPSMAALESQIRTYQQAGVKLITLNGAYNWALAHGMIPSAQIIVDAREFNKRFTKPIVDGCKYLLASQCHPSVFEGLPKERVYLWHTSTDLIADTLDATYGKGGYYHIPGGSTVLLRALPLLRMLGFTRFHLFGCDSCLSESEAHHAYAQPENDNGPILNIGGSMTGGRMFKCHPWMASQAQEMYDTIRLFGDEIELEIYGDGLLAHMLKTAAALEDAPPSAH